VFLNDLAGGEQTQSGSLAALGSEEGGEDFALYF